MGSLKNINELMDNINTYIPKLNVLFAHETIDSRDINFKFELTDVSMRFIELHDTLLAALKDPDRDSSDLLYKILRDLRATNSGGINVLLPNGVVISTLGEGSVGVLNNLNKKLFKSCFLFKNNELSESTLRTFPMVVLTDISICSSQDDTYSTPVDELYMNYISIYSSLSSLQAHAKVLAKDLKCIKKKCKKRDSMDLYDRIKEYITCSILPTIEVLMLYGQFILKEIHNGLKQ